MKCLLAVLICLLFSAPSFARSTESALWKVNSGTWTAYNIGRDYLGNITHIATTGGTLVAEYSYDPWGRLRNPATQAIYTPGNEPELFLGRGFTGHEHLIWFGLINMNARLYDPLLGRFLSPDPYVQAPDFTQNFNRYSYALNNPLRYSDPNGEFVFTTAIIVGIAIGTVAGMATGYMIGREHGAEGWQMFGYIAGGGLIGGVAGFAGGYVASVVAPLAAAAGYGGFAAGAVTGGLAGATSGAISGFGYSLLEGKPFADAVYAGGISALTGLATGAIVGGIAQGVQSLKNGNHFWTGQPKQVSSNSTKIPSIDSNKSTIKERPLNSPSDFPDTKRYSLTPSVDDPNVTLYRGTTGSEYDSSPLFMTDDPAYAAEYIKNGGHLVKVTLPKFTLELMRDNGDLFTKTGYYSPPNDLTTSYTPHTEYMFSAWIKPFIVNLFIPL